MRSLIDILELSLEEIDSLIETACDIKKNPEKYADKCRGKKLATLFFEPSTRTRLSFEAAMYGGLSGYLSLRCWGLSPCVELVPEPEGSSPY